MPVKDHSSGKIRVGIVGASTNPFQWGAAAHIPALRALPEYDIVAVASTRQETADAAAAMHGIPMAFGDYREMASYPDIDLICVVTSVMSHYNLVLPALEAGKNVFCEWPLGANTKQAVALRDAAKSRGIQTLIGLQNQCAPLIQYVRSLIAEGYIGRLMSADLARSSDQLARVGLTSAWAYFLDKDKANSALMILGAHALDTLAACLGEFQNLQACEEVMVSEVTLRDTGMPFHVTAPDHIFVQGNSIGGAVLGAQVKMHSPVSAEFRLEISGTKGGLIVVSGELDPNVRQAGVPGNLELYGTSAIGVPFERLEVPSSYQIVPATTPQSEALNVAQLYRGFSERLSTGAAPMLDFDHAVIRHRLLDTIQDAAASGQREPFRSDP